MDVLGGLLGVDETWMRGVDKDFGVGGGEVAVQISGVEKYGELGATVLAILTEVSV